MAEKRIAIMQPYFFPYIGYFQLMASVDEFIVYDNIQYTKRGWINRNRIISGGKERKISLPIKSSSDYLDIVDKELAHDWPRQKNKLINIITEAYRKAPNFEAGLELIIECFEYNSTNLFEFLFNQLELIKEWLSIKTILLASSEINANHNLKSQNRVLSICKARGTDVYVNPIGGIDLYDKTNFSEYGVRLKFLNPKFKAYPQFSDVFIPGLSIIDVIMHCDKMEIQKIINDYEYK